MNRPILYTALTVFFCLIFLSGTAFGGEESIDAFTLKSALINDAYQIEVALPLGYEDEPDRRYPTIVVLDGNWNAENARRIADKLIEEGEIGPVIIVSVCPIQALQNNYTGMGDIRCRDLTPTFVKKHPGSGMARQFGGFIKDELIPYIDARYRTLPDAEDRCLVGHSLGGLFTYYMLFTHHDTFKKFMAFSSSIWWDKRIILRMEEEYGRSHRELNARLYTTVGGRELFMRGNQRKMVRQLENRHYDGFFVSSEVIKGANHITNWNPSFERGLRLFFGE